MIRIRCLGIVDRHACGTPLHIEIDGGNGIETPQCLPHGSKEYLANGLLVLKLYLRLCGMDVDINRGRVYLQEEEIGHLVGGRNQFGKSLLHRLVEIRMAHIATIDVEELADTLLACRLGLADKSTDGAECRFDLHGEQLLCQLLAKQGSNALLARLGRKADLEMLIVGEREAKVGIDQGHALKLLHDVGQLGLVALEKLSACRHIEEEMLHKEVGTDRTAGHLLRHDTAARQREAGANLSLGGTSAQGHFRYGCNAGKCLTAKAHRRERKEVVGLRNLACRMAFKGQAGIGFRHSLAVVGDADGRATGIHDNHVDAMRPGIHGILQQFLDDRCRTLDDLAGSNLIGHRVG